MMIACPCHLGIPKKRQAEKLAEIGARQIGKVRNSMVESFVSETEG
jgi:hypothetical protein